MTSEDYICLAKFLYIIDNYRFTGKRLECKNCPLKCDRKDVKNEHYRSV